MCRAHLLHLLYGFLLVTLVSEGGVDCAVVRLELGLDLPELPPGQHLDVAAHLLPRPRLAGPELDVSGDQLVPPVHLALVGQDDLPPATWGVDGQGLLEALLNVGGPDALGILIASLLVIIKLAGVKLCYLVADGLGDSREPNSVITLP